MYISFLGLILATAKIPGMSKGEQGVKNQLKGINLLNSPESLNNKGITRFPSGFALGKSLKAALPALGKPRRSFPLLLGFTHSGRFVQNLCFLVLLIQLK